MSRRFLKKMTFFVLELILGFGAAAQNQMCFSNINIGDGLSSSYALDVCQDSKGSIWVATMDGLNRYDGNKVETFSKEKNKGLATDHFRSVKPIGDDLIIGTAQGIFFFDHISETFKELECKSCPEAFVNESFVTSEGTAYFATDQGLLKYSDGKLDLICKQGPMLKVISDKRGNVWAITTKKLLHFTETGEILDHHEFGINLSSIVIDDFGSLLLGTQSEGVLIFDQVTSKLKPLIDDGYRQKEMKYVRCMMPDGRGQLWIGTESGLFIFSYGDRLIQHYTKNFQTSSAGIGSNAVYSIFKSREDIVWVGSYYGGVDYVDVRPKKMNFFIPDDGLKSLKGHAVKSIMEDSKGKIWFATEDSGISIYDKQTHNFSHLNKESRPALSGNNVHSLIEDRFGNVWAATYLDGLQKISPDRNRVEYIPIPVNDVNTLALWQEDTLLIATPAGMFSCDIRNNSVKDFHDDLFQNKDISNLTIDNDGNLWICTTSSKQFRYDSQSRKIEAFGFAQGVRDAICAADGTLWFATTDIKLISLKDGKTLSYDISDGNTHRMLKNILEDPIGRLWVSTNKGIICFQEGSAEIMQIDVSDDMISNQFMLEAALRDKDDFLYFGTIYGACCFQADMLGRKDYYDNPPRIYFSNMTIFGEPQAENEKVCIDEAQEIKLTHRNNSISFDIAPILQAAGVKARYYIEYQMSGVDDDYIKTLAEPLTATYKRMSTGHHNFKVRITDCSGHELAARNVQFVVRPMFVLSPGMLILYLIVFIIGLICVKNLISWRNKEMTNMQLSEQRMKLITYISHELKSPLSVISAILDEHIISDKITLSDVSIVSRNIKRMQYLIKQLLDYRALETGNVKANYTKGDIVKFLRGYFNSFRPLFRQKELDVEISAPETSCECYYDSDAIEKIYGNLLSNAAKHSLRHGQIKSEISVSEDNILHISVFNANSYIPEDRIDSVTQPFFKSMGKENSGIGLAIVDEYVRILGGKMSIKSDKSTGTSFIVDLPLKNEAPETDNSENAAESINYDIIENAYYELRTEAEKKVDSKTSSKYTILVAEDNIDFNNVLTNKLTDDYKIIQAYDGLEAEKAITADIDLLISDVNLSGRTGIELCDYIKMNTRLAHIPVILITSDASETTKIEGLSHGADSFIEKPFQFQELAIRIKNLLSAKDNVKTYVQGQSGIEMMEHLSNKQEEFLSSLTQFVKDNIQNPELNVGSLAEHAKISKTLMYNRLKSLTKMSASEFISKIRMDMAMEKLTMTDMNISEISWDLGFSSPSYFVKMFKKRYGMTPNAFRKSTSRKQESSL